MSKLSHSCQETMDEIEQRALFSRDSGISYDEAYEILDANGVSEIKWSEGLNAAYAMWMYFNIK